MVDIRYRRKRVQTHRRAGHSLSSYSAACRIGLIGRVLPSTRAISTLWRIPITHLGNCATSARQIVMGSGRRIREQPPQAIDGHTRASSNRMLRG